jgi:hypothetical protein
MVRAFGSPLVSKDVSLLLSLIHGRFKRKIRATTVVEGSKSSILDDLASKLFSHLTVLSHFCYR